MRITYGITGTFPWTFTSRRMTILTFSHFFLFSRPTHSCTDIKFIDNATKSSGCRTCQCRRPFLCAECSVTHMQNKKNSHTSSLALSSCKLIALRVTSQLADRFVAGEYLKHVSQVKGGPILKHGQAVIAMYGFTTRSEYSFYCFFIYIS